MDTLIQRFETLVLENFLLRQRLQETQEELDRRNEQIEALRGDANEETYEDA